MREANYLEGLVQLHRISDPEERGSVWRQSMATLAAAVSDHRRYVPLEGLDPSALRDSCKVAIDTGLLDHLSFLSAAARGAALYELASALPSCKEKRAIGRHVLASMRIADGRTFVGMATQIALGGSKALSGAGNRARVALSLDLPLDSSSRADALALALISRRGSSIEWLRSPSMGSLPSRRLAARLLERAAREAAQRASEGDDSGVRIFDTPDIRDAWSRLLADRESLVWRHVASARGLLSVARPDLAEEIERHLGEGLGVTEWRRAAASTVASIAVRPEAIQRARSLLGSLIMKKDPGIAAAMLLALPRVAEVEPELATEFADLLVRAGDLSAAEALVELRRERVAPDFGDWAAKLAVAHLKERLNNEAIFDDGAFALLRCVIAELEGEPPGALIPLIDRGVELFHTEGPVAARGAALHALDVAHRLVDELEEHVSDEDSIGRRWAFRAIRTIDRALLASDSLANLLSLSSKAETADKSVRPLGDLFQRLTNWLVIHEGYANQYEEAPHFVHRLRRLRTFLRLVDADGRRVDDRPEMVRQRRLLTAQVLLGRVRDDKAKPLRRALCAAAARACDALVREETCEVSDILLVAGRLTQTHHDQRTMAEASMVPDLDAALRAYARLERTIAEREGSTGRAARASLDDLSRLAHELPIATSPRVEALRSALLDLMYSLEPLVASASLRELAERSGGEMPLAPLERAVQTLAQLSAGAARRLASGTIERPESGHAVRFVDIHLERALRGNSEGLAQSIEAAAETLGSELPKALVRAIVSSMEILTTLPVDAPRHGRASFLPVAPKKEVSLPAWVPPSRVIGGFYLSRPIGAGAVGSVFVARRSDARHDAAAEQFALKVPDYSGAAARTLSEEEFLDLFRQEAGALLSLPAHPNLAGFVTFDARARPKPLLVMELVEGPNLERVIESRDLDMPRVMGLLFGIASGLEAMHSVGVAHLDLKPSNVIARDSDGLVGPALPEAPVLVDFGLAGRQLRPGCGTASYGAPEVWGHDHGSGESATPADVYAFGCLAYELLTGRTLFEEANDLATITAHLTHDGLPARIGTMSQDPRTRGAAEMVRRAIRRNSDDRVSMTELRVAIQALTPGMCGLSWPLQA
ncbi:MAG: hypothetical protein ACI9KE_001508 [Polyangiales bacterium]